MQDAESCGNRNRITTRRRNSVTHCVPPATTARRSRTCSARKGSRRTSTSRSCSHAGCRTMRSATSSACCCSGGPFPCTSFPASEQLRRLGFATEDGRAARATRAHRPHGGRLALVRHVLARRFRPAGLGFELLADRVLARIADAAATRRAGARHRHRQRRPRAARVVACRSCRGHRRQRARAGLHADQRRAERHRQRRDATRQPVRAGRRRALRPDHVQRAVRDLADGALAVPRRRLPRRRALPPGRDERRSAPRRRRVRGRARQLAGAVGGRSRRADARLARRKRVRRVGARAQRLGPARPRRGLAGAPVERPGCLRRRDRRVDAVLLASSAPAGSPKAAS